MGGLTFSWLTAVGELGGGGNGKDEVFGTGVRGVEDAEASQPRV